MALTLESGDCAPSVETITNCDSLWRQKNILTECCHFPLYRLAAAPRLLHSLFSMSNTNKTTRTIAAPASPAPARRLPTTKKGTIRFYALPMVATVIQIERWAAIAKTPGRVIDDLVEHAKASGFTPRAR